MGAIVRIGDRLRRWAPAILRRAAYAHTAGDVVQDTMLLRDSLILLDALSRSLLDKRREGACQFAKFDGLHLLSCMRLMMDLRNRSKLPWAIERALDIAVPAMADSIRKELAHTRYAPSASTLSRNQCFLDAALLFLQKDAFRAQPHLFYIMADSSPQCSYNFFLSHMLTIAEPDILTVFKLAQELSACRYQRARIDFNCDEDVVVSEEEAIATLVRRHELSTALELLMVWVTNLPQCLGSGATSLSTKVRLIMHGFWMFSEHPRLRTMIGDLANVIAFTSDMGTELGLAEFQVPCIRAAMAPWMFPEQHGHPVLPVDEGLADANADDDADCDPMQERPVFPRALVIPGVLHIFHNLSWKIDDSMPSFKKWLDGMKSVVTLMHYKQNREKFIDTCVRGSVFDTPRSPVNAGLPSTTDWRWGSIVHVVTMVLPLKNVLQGTFDVSAMTDKPLPVDQQYDAASSREREGKLNLHLIRDTVNSGWWWAFTHMIETLHKILADFQAWCEGCPCHYDVKHLKGEARAEFARLQREAGFNLSC